jgi:hypothetical protein
MIIKTYNRIKIKIKQNSRLVPIYPVRCKNLIQIDLLENMREFQSHLQFLVE